MVAPATEGIPGITVLVSNYYKFDYPIPEIKALLDLAVTSFAESLQQRIAGIQAELEAAERSAGSVTLTHYPPWTDAKACCS